MDTIDELKALLKGIGIKTFVDYYSFFDAGNKKSILEEFIKNNEEWNSTSVNTKISNGLKIFRDNLNELALIYIIKKSDASIETKSEADLLLQELRAERFESNLQFEPLDEDINDALFWRQRDIDEERNNITGKF